MFDWGLSLDKLVIILVIAMFLIGPERLPRYAAKLGQLVRGLRDLANGAKDRMREEMGEDFDDLEWSKLDPRQYDPRRIIREALEDSEPAVATATATATVAAASTTSTTSDEGESAGAEAGAAVADPDVVAEPEPPRIQESAYQRRKRLAAVKAAAEAGTPFDAEAT